MKRITSLLLAIMMMFTLAACNTGNGNAEETTAPTTAAATDTATATPSTPNISGTSIEVAVGYTDTNLTMFQTLIDQFTQETGVKVELLTPGADYETQLKTMMASNELPDVWMTHGWSLLRYSEYLQTVNDQPWFDQMDTASLAGVMADSSGNFYALGLSMSVSGLVYNADTLKAAGVDPTTITTWDAFEAACDKVLAAGYTPIVIGGSSSSNFAGFLGSLAPTFWTDKGAKYDLATSLQGGTFDFKYATELYTYMADWINAGYFNKDVMTLDSTGAQQMLGSGQAAFMMRGISNITVARQYYPNANFGVLPLPSSASGAPSFRIGEGDAFGVWKDTKNPDACWALLKFLAQPEVVKTICEATANIPAINGTTLTDSYAYDCYLNAQKACGTNVQYDNVFDRKYFPSGMWAIMGDSVSMLFNAPSDITSAVTYLQNGYAEKIAAK